MPRKSTRRRFANRADEAVWWEANEEALACSFEKNLNDGYAGPCTVVVTGDSTAKKIRLGSRDVVRTRSQASKRDLGFHVYLKTIIHEALLKSEISQNDRNS